MDINPVRILEVSCNNSMLVLFQTVNSHFKKAEKDNISYLYVI
jgi:hypothetical protein